ncbi:MAG: hypothetical protein COA69_13460 [Robiginitomaculum sp.]|nr:MAG: hypothetical protein COA69_13460 [Robiginitomaculum sp.]
MLKLLKTFMVCRTIELIKNQLPRRESSTPPGAFPTPIPRQQAGPRNIEGQVHGKMPIFKKLIKVVLYGHHRGLEKSRNKKLGLGVGGVG